MRIMLAAIAALVAAPLAAADGIFITYSPDFEKKVQEDLGERDVAHLADYLQERLEKALDDKGLGDHSVEVIIRDAKPSKPTMTQLSDRPSLDYGQSFSLGGASFTGRILSPAGEVVAETEYKWFEYDIRFAQAGTTWTDARRAARSFARRLVKDAATG